MPRGEALLLHLPTPGVSIQMFATWLPAEINTEPSSHAAAPELAMPTLLHSTTCPQAALRLLSAGELMSRVSGGKNSFAIRRLS